MKHAWKKWLRLAGALGFLVVGGSEDDMIVCMQEGRDCAAGRQRLADKLANGSVPVLAVDDSADEMEEEEEEMVSDDDGSEGHVVTLSDNDDSDEWCWWHW